MHSKIESCWFPVKLVKGTKLFIFFNTKQKNSLTSNWLVTSCSGLNKQLQDVLRRSIPFPKTYNILSSNSIIISIRYNRTNKNCSDWIRDFLSKKLIFFDDFEHRFDLLLAVLAFFRFGWDPSRETCLSKFH